MLYLIPPALLLLGVIFLIPLISGVFFITLSALGWDFFHPKVDCQWTHCRWESFSDLFSHPQFFPSLNLTLRTSLLSVLLSLLLVFIIFGGWSRQVGKISRLIPLWLSYPHISFAIGLVFLVSPSGFLVRWLGYPFGIDIPLDWQTYQDPFGFSFIMGLAFKETIFLLFIAFSQANQIPITEQYRVGASLGYSPSAIWFKIIWPQIYRGIRFPLFIVLSYSFSAVDMGIILAGKTPPPLAILVLRWFQDPDLSYAPLSSAAALVLIAVFFLTLGVWWLGEKMARQIMERLIWQGNKRNYIHTSKGLANFLFASLSIILLLTFFLNGLWSLTRSWPFPKLLPTRYTGETWNFLEQNLGEFFWNSLSLGVASAGLGVTLSIIILEMRYTRFSHLSPLAYLPSRVLLFLPLLLPAVSFFIGVRVFFSIATPTLPTWIATVIGHLLMVLPYTLLTLEKAYHSFNQQYFIIAQTLSGSNFKSYFKIKFPMLKKTLLTSLGIALSVSLMDYLATVVLSGGRIATITTEAVQLSSGGNLRVMGFFAVIQTLLLATVFFSCQNFTSPQPKNIG